MTSRELTSREADTHQRTQSLDEVASASRAAEESASLAMSPRDKLQESAGAYSETFEDELSASKGSADVEVLESDTSPARKSDSSSVEEDLAQSASSLLSRAAERPEEEEGPLHQPQPVPQALRHLLMGEDESSAVTDGESLRDLESEAEAAMSQSAEGGSDVAAPSPPLSPNTTGALRPSPRAPGEMAEAVSASV